MIKIKRILKNLALSFGVKIEKTTSDEQLNAFFRMTRPVSTNHNLIRIGGETDGGYLVPEDLAGIKYCFSPGVSDIAYFEDDLAVRGVRSYLADYSVDASPSLNPLFNFEKKYIGMEDNNIYMTLKTWVDKNIQEDNSDLILQMDIEGNEYDVIIETSNELFKRFRILVVEFHSLENLLDRSGFQLINASFTKILKNFEIVHIHPNNCCAPIIYKNFEIPPVMEFTFLRKDRITHSNPTLVFPNLLDQPNDTKRNNFSLPHCWYKF